MEEIDVNIGDVVICDICNTDYTGTTVSGGFIFGSYAYCPLCEEKGLESIKKHRETHMIRAYCPDNMSFANFIINSRK